VLLKNDECMAHQAYSAADYIMVPSLYEPCGLTQLIALRYGTIPIVRSTGGLADTILDVSEHPHTGNGFAFHAANADEFERSVVRALEYCGNVEQKKTLVLRAMGEDFSWGKPCEEYERLYT
jgi:starch synthase